MTRTFSDAKSETDLCVCIVSNCSRHQSSSSRVAIACDNELSSIWDEEINLRLIENHDYSRTWCCHCHLTKIRWSSLSTIKLTGSFCSWISVKWDDDVVSFLCSTYLSGGMWVRSTKFFRTFFKLASSWANGVTIMSSWCLYNKIIINIIFIIIVIIIKS